MTRVRLLCKYLKLSLSQKLLLKISSYWIESEILITLTTDGQGAEYAGKLPTQLSKSPLIMACINFYSSFRTPLSRDYQLS